MMKNEKLYNKTVDILVKGYFDDTLRDGDCACCAVGNMIAANMNCRIAFVGDKSLWLNKQGDVVKPRWTNVFYTTYRKFLWKKVWVEQKCNPDNFEGDERRQITSTGYNLQELASIEHAFELGAQGVGDKMFNGLMAVIETLDVIHENNDKEISVAAKKKFIKTEQEIH